MSVSISYIEKASWVTVEPKVFDVLTYLLHNRDRVVSKDELIDKLWPGQVVSETALTRCIVAARKAVGDDGPRQEMIETQYGRGYRFMAVVTEHDKDTDPPLSAVALTPVSALAGMKECVDKWGVQPPLDERRSPAAPATRSWSSRSFVLVGALLLVGIIVMVQHLSQPSLSTQDSAPSTASPQTLALLDKPSIVVLPFTNLSGDSTQDHLSDGITDDLITTLARFPDLFVIARHSAFTYKGKTLKEQVVGKELVTLHDAFPIAHTALGFVYLWQKQYDQAIVELERAVALDRSYVCGQMLLAGGLSQIGRIEEAVQVDERALSLKALPSDDRCLFGVASAYALAGRREEAATLPQRMLKQFPNFLGAHLDLSVIYSELGREAEVRAEVAEVLCINPQFSLEVHKQRVPLKDPTTLERYVAALRKAGLK